MRLDEHPPDTCHGAQRIGRCGPQRQRGNPAFAQRSDLFADLRRIANALAETGKDPAKVTPVGWGLITAWIAATAQMFDALRQLD